MSFLGKLFGGGAPADERARADALFAKQEFAPAKLAYEKALRALAKDAPGRGELDERIHACRDELAKQRIDQAEVWLEQDSPELAIAELKAAIDTAHDDQLVRKAEARLLSIE